MSKTPRRYEKVDANTVKIIVEQEKNIDLAGLIAGRDQLTAQIEDLTDRLKNIKEIIEEAKKLGIVPKVKEKQPSAQGKPTVIRAGRGEKPKTPKPKDKI